jgi:hypothetical protein
MFVHINGSWYLPFLLICVLGASTCVGKENEIDNSTWKLQAHV